MDRNTIVNIGGQRFDRIREQGAFYIDKTGFIKEWWESGSDVTLITRPRRFGKTLNMSMIECFFSNQYVDRGDLFDGLLIWKDEKYRRLQGTYPVISLSFAGIKTRTAKGLKKSFKGIITDTCRLYQNLMVGNTVSYDADRAYFESINDNMSDESAAAAIKRLCGCMERRYGKKPIILLDEYDTPMQESWLGGYWDEAVGFFGSFFDMTFKTNPHLYRGIITGITKVSKESIFSDLNNLKVVTTTSDQYAAAFGFTEEEVFRALDDTGLGDKKQGVKQWYDGITFGKCTDIYNPWSIASFIEEGGKYRTFWSNTSGNELINSLIQQGNTEIKQTMEELLNDKSFETVIDEQIAFSELDKSADAVWSLLLATGYLKVSGTRGAVDDEDDVFYTLTLTNLEVKKMFTRMVRNWFGYGDTKVYYNEFINALLSDNIRKMNTFMNKVALNTFSSFDSGNHPSDETQPERLVSCCDRMGAANGSSLCFGTNLQSEADASRFYHGFVLGMVINLAGRYKIRSNRERGPYEPCSYGRYDVMIEPLDKIDKAFIFEFKVMAADDDEQTLEDTIVNAHKQIEEKKYEAELISEGFSPTQIRKYGFAFKGKECLIG